MSFMPNIPPSVKAKMSAAEDDKLNDKKMDYKKMKEIEENRKNALIPAMQDENGVDINPHIPEYMMKAPWYTGATRPTLSHQRAPEDKKEKYVPLDKQYIRGPKNGTGAAKYRKGACENCGAMGHDKKSCLERMRTNKAKYTNICAPDDRQQPDLKLSYDAKRDPWMGYNVENRKDVELKYKMVEELRSERKAKQLESTLLEGENKDDDEELNNDDIPIPCQNFDKKEKYHIKQLRIREDKPKYLFNLDLNSAYYDPKSRSMRGNPFEGQGKNLETVPYAGDNMVRWSGDVKDAYEKEIFASECHTNGMDLNAFGDPTRVELFHQQHKMEKVKQSTEISKSLIEAYGGREHFDVLPDELLMGQSEEYVEYTRRGVQIKGNVKRVIRSKYEEDELERNHTAVWGSYWEDGKWGFKCCHSTFRNSYCIGKIGFAKELQSQEELVAEDDETIHQNMMIDIKSNSLSQQPVGKDSEGEMKRSEEKKPKKNHKKRQHSSDSSSESSSSSPSDKDEDEPKHKKSRKSDSKKKSKKHKKKHRKHKHKSDDSEDREIELKKAIKKEKERLRQVEQNMEKGIRQQSYNATYDSKEPSKLETEAYQILRKRDGDPMA